MSAKPTCSESQTDAPRMVPVGGGDQTVTITWSCTSTAGNPPHINIPVGVNLEGVTVVSLTPPPGLPTAAPNVTGEAFAPPRPSDHIYFGIWKGGYGWSILGAVPGKTYSVALRLHSPNPFGVPFGQILDVVLVTESGGKEFFQGTQSRPLAYAGEGAGETGRSVTLAAQFLCSRNGVHSCSDPVPTRDKVTFRVGSQSCTGTSAFSGQGAVAGCTLRLHQPPGRYKVTATFGGDLGTYPQANELVVHPGDDVCGANWCTDPLLAGIYPTTVTSEVTIAAGESGSTPPGQSLPVTHLKGGGSLVEGSGGADDAQLPAGPATADTGAGNDTIHAGTGNDTITPGPGRDTVVLGNGRSTVFAVDHTRDTVVCGKGKATIYADKIDKLESCKHATVYRR